MHLQIGSHVTHKPWIAGDDRASGVTDNVDYIILSLGLWLGLNSLVRFIGILNDIGNNMTRN